MAEPILNAPRVVAGIGQGVPPDFELDLIQDEPPGWVNIANLTLLAELRRRAPAAIDWTVADVTPLLVRGGAGLKANLIGGFCAFQYIHSPSGSSPALSGE
jgi:hypothetical protein